ncbi:oxidoreductase [Legionella israelensis]|uniref:Oxidoreductase n=1 Tax=Legionella israelensis TaxID=454 RepID=A0AAX1EJE6_9GAMM|nr:oxidoreductase [Legionella israelensis]QBR85246.1 oxidoreductase [Legionella israelensis]
MGKGTIVRIRDDIQLAPTFFKNLHTIIGDFKIENYSEKRNLKSIYQDRINNLFDAFCFILEAYPPNKFPHAASPDILRQYATRYKNECHLSEDIDSLQQTLSRFAARLVTELVENWTWTAPEVNEAIACLNEADQYVLMGNGAEDIATIMPMQFGLETYPILLWDKRLPSHSELLVSELEEIKKLNAPETPHIRDLEEYQQVYFLYLDKSLNTGEAIKIDFNTFYLKWLELIKEPELLSQQLKMITQEGMNVSWFSELSLSQQHMLCTLADKPIDEISRILKKFDGFLSEHQKNEKTIHELLQIDSLPQWYCHLSERQQKFLGYVLKKAPSVQDAISFLPSRLRTLPLLPNFRAHKLLMLDKEGRFIKDFGGERYASSHIASREVRHLPGEIQKRHVTENLKTVLKLKDKESQFILIQTLISPAPLLNYMPRSLGEIPPDYELSEALREAIDSKEDPSIIHINHPMNIAKRYYYTSSNEPRCLALLEKAQSRFEEKTPEGFLAKKYEEVLNSGIGSATVFDWNGRELFLTSYEHLLILALKGRSYGSCVSGKDRKSIEFIHTNAMFLYREKYGCWPDFYDGYEKRKNFVNIVVDEYVTCHFHELAKQNGGGGIKTPANYWPADIAEAIKERLGENALVEDDRMATNVEVSRIGYELYTYYKSKEACRDACKNTAILLGEKNCQHLIDTLGILLDEKERFLLKKNRYYLLSPTPNESTGITNIRNLIKNSRLEKTKSIHRKNHALEYPVKASPIDITADILYEVRQRPLENNIRSETTQKVYDVLRDLSDCPHMAPEKIASIMKEIKNLKESSFLLNRRSHSDPELTSLPEHII